MEMGSEREGIRKGGCGGTLICAPLMADTVGEMVEQMHKAKVRGADLVEIRLDSLKSFTPPKDVDLLIQQCPLPTLFTYRFIVSLLLSNCNYLIMMQTEINVIIKK